MASLTVCTAPSPHTPPAGPDLAKKAPPRSPLRSGKYSSAASASPGLLASPKRPLWVQCQTPTTGRAYYIHRRTGKISWTDPYAKPSSDKKQPEPLSLPGSAAKAAARAAAAAAAAAPKRTALLARAKSPAGFSWTSDEKRHMQRFYRRWSARHERRAFGKWKLFMLWERCEYKVRSTNLQVAELEDSLRLVVQKNDAAMAIRDAAVARQREEEARKAAEQTAAAIRQAAARRLAHWVGRRTSVVRAGWDRWVRRTQEERMLQMAELQMTVNELRHLEQRVLPQMQEAAVRSRTLQEELESQVAAYTDLAEARQAEVEVLHAKCASMVEPRVHETACQNASQWERRARAQAGELDLLRAKYMNEKSTWERRFTVQQEQIDRLEHDVEELSELKVRTPPPPHPRAPSLFLPSTFEHNAHSHASNPPTHQQQIAGIRACRKLLRQCVIILQIGIRTV